jgi:NAD(P)-dependent dehydrogenase (short-subunit alcohol dehydrogenase family)
MQAIPLVAPLVDAAKGKFVFITSGMGSIGEVSSSGAWLYRVSKAALNMAVKSASLDYPKTTFIAMNPGWVQTDMGGANASITVEESVAGMCKTLDSVDAKHSGSFYSYNGRQLPW